MKKVITSLLFSVITLFAFAQSSYTISGRIIDETTKMPLQGASVFAENTTLGTATDNDGVFNSYNSASYSYCYQNPIRYVDPDGKTLFKRGLSLLLKKLCTILALKRLIDFLGEQVDQLALGVPLERLADFRGRLAHDLEDPLVVLHSVHDPDHREA